MVSEDIDGSTIAEVTVRASSPVSCAGVVITFLTSGMTVAPISIPP